MGQIITNTFFDDCEAIVNENGRPVFVCKITEPAPEETLGQRAKRFGLSEEVAKDLTVLAGVTTFVKLGGADGVPSAYGVSAYGVSVLTQSTGSNASFMLGVALPVEGVGNAGIILFTLFYIHANYLDTPTEERLNLMCSPLEL